MNKTCDFCDGKSCENLTEFVGRIVSHEEPDPYITVRPLQVDACNKIKQLLKWFTKTDTKNSTKQ